MKIWATNGWNKLNSCILGDVYAPEYFDHLANGKVKDVMKRVLHETKEDLEYSALDIDALNVDLLVDVLDVIEELDKVVKGSGQSVSGNIGSFQVDGAVEGLNQDSQYNVFIEDEKLVFFRDVNGVIEIAFDSGSNVYLQTIVQGYEGVILIGDGDDSEIIINQSN